MKDSRGRRSRKMMRLLTEILVAAIVIALSGAALMFYERSSRKREGLGDSGKWGEETGDAEEQDIHLALNERVYAYTDRLETYLLIGTDNSGANPEAQQGFNGDMADFLVLFLVDPDTGRYGFVQIDRDTITDVPILDEIGEEVGTALEQICIAHWYGQNEEERIINTVHTVSELFGGLPIDGYYSMNMKDIPSLNHAVGGVSVTIEDDLESVDPEMTKGVQILLTDEQAEKFVRARISVGDGTNISRLRRQRQYMENLYRQIYERFSDNAGYINDLYKELKSILQTDQPDKTISEIAAKIHESENVGIMTLDGTATEGNQLDDGEIHSEFYVDEASIAENLGKIIDLRDVTEEVITEDEQMIIEEEFTDDEEIVSE